METQNLHEVSTTHTVPGCEPALTGILLLTVIAGEALAQVDTAQKGGCYDEGAYGRVQPSVHPVPDSTVQDEDGSASRETCRRAQGPDRQARTK